MVEDLLWEEVCLLLRQDNEAAFSQLLSIGFLKSLWLELFMGVKLSLELLLLRIQLRLFLRGGRD